MKKRVFIRCFLGILLAAVLACSVAYADIAMHPSTDVTDGTSFMIPDGWTEDNTPQQGYESILSWIQPPDSTRKVVFFHISLDDWDNGKQYVSTRPEYDDLMNNKQTVSASLGTVDIEEVEFNGVTYFRYKSQESTWQYFRYHNAVLHLFQFDVDTDDPYYAYFEAIMNSVEYPAK